MEIIGDIVLSIILLTIAVPIILEIYGDRKQRAKMIRVEEWPSDIKLIRSHRNAHIYAVGNQEAECFNNPEWYDKYRMYIPYGKIEGSTGVFLINGEIHAIAFRDYRNVIVGPEELVFVYGWEGIMEELFGELRYTIRKWLTKK